jgi:hypothetical protein
MLQKLYDPQHQGIMGPRYEHMFRNAALAVMADPERRYVRRYSETVPRSAVPEAESLKHVKDQTVLDFWQKEYAAVAALQRRVK